MRWIVGARSHAGVGGGHVVEVGLVAHCLFNDRSDVAMELNRIQEALVAHLSAGEYQQMLDDHARTLGDTQALITENSALRDRVEYLEREITTHAFGGWVLH
ncbi:MAG: hypothetical protein V7754_20080 [Halioglobus sp.]